jgi:hypothetical protein
MFEQNKYTKTYYSIIYRAKTELRSKKHGYFEIHHIIPQCSPFCGSNKKDNLVLLTAKEHFICHMLLTKMCKGEGKYKMICALNNMSRISKNQNRTITSAQYAYVKRQLSKAKKGSKHSKETIQKFKNRTPWNKGKTKETDERIKIYSENMSGDNHHKPMLGRSVSIETKNKLSEGQLGTKNSFYGKKHNEETKNKISSGRLGKKHDEETKKKMSEAKKLNNPGSAAVKGCKWVTNGDKSLLLKPGEKIPSGFIYGRTTKRVPNNKGDANKKL